MWTTNVVKYKVSKAYCCWHFIFFRVSKYFVNQPVKLLTHVSKKRHKYKSSKDESLDWSPVYLVIQSLVQGLVQGFSNVLFWIHCDLKQNICEASYNAL